MKKNENIRQLADELREIKLHIMADALEELFASKDFDSIDRLDFLHRIIGPEYESKTAKAYEGRLERAHLKGSPQTICNCKDSTARNYLPTGIVDTLSSLDFIHKGLNVCILGASDSGKTYLAKALAIQSCLKHRVSYEHCEPLLECLVALKEADYTAYQKRIRFLIKLDLLIMDDFLLHTISDEREIKVLHEILETRSELEKSTIVCSQREPKSWPSMILNDEVAADAIKKRATKHYTIVIKV